MLNKLTTLQVIQNKLLEGYETMYLYIEDSLVTIQLQLMLRNCCRQWQLMKVMR